MKRAALIITDADEIGYQELRRNAFGEHASAGRRVMPSEHLLADLQALAYPGPGMPQAISDAAARVRALLPEEEDEHE